MRLSKETGKQRDEGDADEGNAAARHELLHALALRAGVIVAVTFQQVDGSPDAKTSTESDDERLENANSRIEKCHKCVCRNSWDWGCYEISRE